MAAPVSPTPPPFVAPAPGAWSLESGHFSRPLTRFYAERFGACLREGFSAGTRRYGALLDYIDVRFVHQVPYIAYRPVGAPTRATHPPPFPVFKVLTWLHPEIRRRLRTAETVFRDKIWRQDLQEWDTTVKPRTLATHMQLQAVDPQQLTTDGLLQHLERCRAWGHTMIVQHHRYNIPALLCVGDLLAHARAWTGLGPAELLPLLRGVSPASRGRSPELQALVQALQAHAPSLQRLMSGDAASEILQSLAQAPGDVGVTFRAYIDAVGYCLVSGYDIADCYALELPEVLLAGIRDAATHGFVPASLDAETTRVRDAVPAAQRDLFDALLAEARTMYRLRDERSLFSDLWAFGILRRVVLHLGARLHAQGRLAQPEHVVEASYAEMRSLLGGGVGPSGDELAQRYAYRTTFDLGQAPREIGKLPGPPPPAAWLPVAARRVFHAVFAALDLVFGELDVRNEARSLHGVSASLGVYEGTARRVVDTGDLARVRQGDILVTRATSSGFNMVLPLLGAIVTDRGGPLCHAAIVAREFGIPAIVGLRDATHRIHDGARLRVNGNTGEARILA